MNFKKVIVLVLFLVMYGNVFSQNSQTSQTSIDVSKGDKQLELKTNVKQLSSDQLSGKDPEINTSPANTQKSPGLAALFSLIIPGAGHFYINRMDVGKYFFGIDVASWIGYGTMTVYSNDVMDDAETYSVEHAGVTNVGNKNDDYFSNVGNYANIYEYNNSQLTFGNYTALYNVDQYYWSWDNSDNQNIYESQRKSSQRISNNRIIFGSMLIANRLVSGISAYILAKQNNKKPLSYFIQPEILMKKDLSFDGLKINLVKNF